MAETTYVILRREDPVDGGWKEIGKQAAGSGETAVRAFLNTSDNGDKFGEGHYRGVSERSWGESVPIQKKISFG